MLTIMQKKELLQLARNSIEFTMKNHQPLFVDSINYDAELREKRTSFITLVLDGQLRGNAGGLVANKSLVQDVIEHAQAAAFNDKRFHPLSGLELAKVIIDISVLSQLEPLEFTDENDLIAQLNVGKDGVVLYEKGVVSTFLPIVWRSLKDPKKFIQHLKIKAGFAEDYWSDTIKISKYTVDEFSE